MKVQINLVNIYADTNMIKVMGVSERDNWILSRGLRREKDLIRKANKSCSDQKMNCIIENMYIKSGIYLNYPD